MDKHKSSVQYTNAGDEYFAKRGLRKYAGSVVIGVVICCPFMDSFHCLIAEPDIT